jgi:hypothetical protein
MNKVYQTDSSNKIGDCLRACIASIFELSIDHVPNFWLETEDIEEFWEKVRQWVFNELGCVCVALDITEGGLDYFKDVLGIACGTSPRNSSVGHAVVWKSGTVFDPHPSGVGLAGNPDTFVVFIPLDPLVDYMKRRA